MARLTGDLVLEDSLYVCVMDPQYFGRSVGGAVHALMGWSQLSVVPSCHALLGSGMHGTDITMPENSGSRRWTGKARSRSGRAGELVARSEWPTVSRAS